MMTASTEKQLRIELIELDGLIVRTCGVGALGHWGVGSLGHWVIGS